MLVFIQKSTKGRYLQNSWNVETKGQNYGGQHIGGEQAGQSVLSGSEWVAVGVADCLFKIMFNSPLTLNVKRSYLKPLNSDANSEEDTDSETDVAATLS